MDWSHALIAEHRHAALIAEAANWRLAKSSRLEPEARETRPVIRRLPLPARFVIAR